MITGHTRQKLVASILPKMLLTLEHYLGIIEIVATYFIDCFLINHMICLGVKASE